MVPGGKGAGPRRRAVHLDRPRAQCVAPRELSEVPPGERRGIVYHDDQIFLPAGVLLADFGVAVLDQQPAAGSGAGPRISGVVEADEHSALGKALPSQAARRPRPQHDAGVRVFGRQLGPSGAPALKSRITSHSSRPAPVGSYIDPRPSGLGRISMTPARCSSRNRFESSPRDRPGAPSAISLKVLQPMRMLRRMMMDQRSANTSAARAMGQNCP